MPWWDELGDKAGPAAGWGTGVAVVFGFLYKFFFKARADLRADAVQERDKRVEDRSIERLERDLARVADAYERIADDINDERRLRLEAEREIVKLEARLFEAMQRIAELTRKE